MMEQSSGSDGRRRNSRIHGGGRLGSEKNRPRGRHASDAGLRKVPNCTGTVVFVFIFNLSFHDYKTSVYHEKLGV